MVLALCIQPFADMESAGDRENKTDDQPAKSRIVILARRTSLLHEKGVSIDMLMSQSS
jgi:hypothetical protein